MVRVEERPDATTTLSTLYTYDGAGNRTAITDARGNITRYEFDALNRVRRLVYPGTVRPATQYSWNNANEMVAETADVMKRLEYDQRGLLRKIIYADGSYEEFQYDAGGRRVGDHSSGYNVSSAHTYDSRNRVTAISRTIDGVTYRLDFTYDSAGNLTSVKYPGDTNTLQYVYDELNRLQAIVGYAGAAGTPGFWYDDADRLVKVRYNNGVVTKFQYDNRHRLTAIQSPVLNLHYAFDAVGNVTRAGDQTYSYDGLGRMTSASQPGQKYGVTYSYDGVGESGRPRTGQPLTLRSTQSTS